MEYILVKYKNIASKGLKESSINPDLIQHISPSFNKFYKITDLSTGLKTNYLQCLNIVFVA